MLDLILCQYFDLRKKLGTHFWRDPDCTTPRSALAGNLLIHVFCKGFTLKKYPYIEGNVLIFHWSYFNYCTAKLGKGRRKSYIRLGAVLWNQRGHEKCFLCCYICGQAYFCFIHTHTTHINRQYVCDLTEYPSINENIPEHDFPEKRFISSFREPGRYYH